MPQLDTVRAFAVGVVMFAHFYGMSEAFGLLGVKAFFVLSGFLITGILIRDRREGTVIPQLKNFYLRRSLRIFPIYYLTIIVATVLNVDRARETFWWNLTYTTNYYVAMHGWIGSLSHFWSLAVEEQFYLVWPLLILAVGRRYLLPVIVGALILVNLNYSTHGFGISLLASSVSTLSSLGWLGIGSLLAYFKHDYPDRFRDLASTKWYAIFGLGCGIGMIALSDAENMLLVAIGQLMPYAFFAWLIHKASTGFKGISRYVFEFRPLLYLGQISYGLYVYHNFTPLLARAAFNAIGTSFSEDGTSLFLLLSLVTIGIASLSWFALEQPVNRLKDRLTARHKAQRENSVTACGLPQPAETS